MVMRGYYKMEDKTNEVLDSAGWLKTGDLGLLDDEGYLNVIGRLKDMIIRGGENIYPREVEDFLMTHPNISEAQVVGIPDEYFGEIPVAFIKPRLGETLVEEEVLAYCKGKISHQKIPKYIQVVEVFPLTASGKIQKNILREQFIGQSQKS
jgi:fatty-acyl-CoA synthase